MSDGRKTWRARRRQPAEPPQHHCTTNRIDRSFRVFACPICHRVHGIVRVADDPVDFEETIQAS